MLTDEKPKRLEAEGTAAGPPAEADLRGAADGRRGGGPSIASRMPLLTNAAANWIGFAAQVVVAFFVSPLLIHGLGDERYGVWSLVDSVLAYLTLFDLGIGASLVRYVARFEAQRDQR